MKTLFTLIIAVMLFPLSAMATDSLAEHMSPKFYRKRSKPVVNVALVYYGEYYSDSDLLRVQELLEKRFHLATDRALSVNTVLRKIIPFKHQIRDYPDYRQDYVTDIERLQRLWYYDNVGAKILKEVYDQMKTELHEIDFLLIVTGAQFDALGFASGRVAVTENPMEIAWGLPDGGRVDYISDAKVVDELIHEMGHTMFLGHASTQCQKPGMTLEETRKCCEASPSKDDVMSYCRKRNKVDENFFYGFKECNLRMIKNLVVPAMLKGKQWNIQGRETCL